MWADFPKIWKEAHVIGQDSHKSTRYSKFRIHWVKFDFREFSSALDFKHAERAQRQKILKYQLQGRFMSIHFELHALE